MLSVKIGHYHPSLENSFVETVRALKKDDPLAPLAVIAPTNWMLNFLQERLVLGENDRSSSKDGADFANISFMNFFVLANEICKRSGSNTGQIVQNRVIYEAIISELLRCQVFRAYFLKDEHSIPPLARSLFQVIQDLTDANIRADSLKDAVQEGFVEGIEIQKLKNIVQLFEMFRQRVKMLHIAQYSDVFRLATMHVSDSNFPGRFKGILAYGFYDLTGAEQDFFGELFRHYPTTLFLPYHKKHPIFAYVKPFYESFVLGLAHDIDEIPPDNSAGFSYILDPAPQGKADDTTLSVSSNDGTQAASGLGRTDADIRIINVSGKKDEVWMVAKEILTLTDNGFRFDEIGVVARMLEPYLNVFKRIFSENCIPFISSAQEPITKYPLLKVIQQLLLLRREDYFRPMVIELLKSPYFRMPAWSRKEIVPNPHLWDVLSRRMDICSGLDLWLTRIAQLKTTVMEPDSETKMHNNAFPESALEYEARRHIPASIEQVELLETILRTLSHDLSSLPEKASWAVMSQKISRLIGNYISIPHEEAENEDKKTDMLILDKIYEVLSTLPILDSPPTAEGEKPNEEVSYDQCVDIFIEACKQECVPVGLEEGLRGVKVLDAMTARGIPFRALFVVGLNEKVFPRAISEDPFLRDHVRRRLSEVLGNLVPEKLRGYDEERLLFYFLLNTARERLYLFFERSDEAGKPKVQSHYLMDFLQNMHGTALKRKERREILHEIYVPRGLKDKLCRKEAELLTPKELCVRTTFQKTDTARCIGMMGVNPVIFNRSLQALTLMERYDSQLTGYDGIVGDMSPWCNKQWSQGVSPTALEVFGACPFRYFMEKTLQLESLEEPENTDMMEAVDIGFLCHAILKDFYDTLIKNGYFRKKQKGIHPLEILRDIATKRFLETERLRPIRHPLLWEIKKEELFAVLSHFVIQDITCIEKTGYVPAYLETVIPLHPQDDLPEAVGRCFRQKEFSGMSLKGKIDRIDIRTLGNMVHYRIIDYKTGKFFKENLVRSAIRGKTMQLPFYIAMAERFISDKMKKGHIPPGRIELDGASFVYITQGNKDKEGDVCLPENAIDRELWVDCGNQCWEAVKEFLEIIRAGLYPVSTQRDSKMCEWCEFTTICRRGHQPLRFRLEHDARLEKYREIINRDIAKKSRKG